MAAGLVPSLAWAWGGDDHAAVGRVAYGMACANSPLKNDVVCTDLAMTQLASDGVVEPDNCHSAFHSSLAAKINPALYSFFTPNCAIKDGDPGFVVPGYNYYGYILGTNANHFGENTQVHYRVYHLAAYYAAIRYRSARKLADANVMASCSRAAVGLEGFANHYLSDSTAAGHMFNAAQYYYSNDSPSVSSSMRGCFHGQGAFTTWALSLGGFDCTNAKENMGTVNNWRDGFGVRPSTNPYGGTWGTLGGRTDDAWDSTDLSQHASTLIPASKSFGDILNVMASDVYTYPWYLEEWQNNLAANIDMCKVAINQCCQSPATWVETVTPDSINEDVTFHCDSCPDVDTSALFSVCQFQTFHHLPRPTKVHWAPWSDTAWYQRTDNDATAVCDITFTSNDPNVPSPQTFSKHESYLQFATASNGSDAARFAADWGTNYYAQFAHPDAFWNYQNQDSTLDQYGCIDLTDWTPPVTSAQPSAAPNANGWNKTAVSVILTAQDLPGYQGEHPSGMANIQYVIASPTGVLGPLTFPGATTAAPASAEGTTTIHWAATDKWGNQEQWNFLSINIDLTPPTLTITGNQPTYDTTATVTITCEAQDALSGLDAANTDCTNISVPAASLGVGPHTYSFKATDLAGHTVTQTVNFTVASAGGIQALMDEVANSVNNPGVASALEAKLQAAQAAAAQGNTIAAYNIIGAFINQVNAQSGKSISPAAAANLITMAMGLKF